MALLRDKKTSAPLFEGTPLEVVLAAEKVGRDEILFDDVGVEFNPDAVLAANEEEVTNSQAIAKSSEFTDDIREAAQARLDSVPSVDDAIPGIESALTEARARVEE